MQEKTERTLKSLESWISYKEKTNYMKKKKKKDYHHLQEKQVLFGREKKEHNQILLDEAIYKMCPDDRFNQNCIQWFLEGLREE